MWNNMRKEHSLFFGIKKSILRHRFITFPNLGDKTYEKLAPNMNLVFSFCALDLNMKNILSILYVFVMLAKLYNKASSLFLLVPFS